MKKLVLALVMMALLCPAALAAEAMEFLEDIYVIVPEEKGDALVRFEGGETPLLSERAEEISGLTAFGGDMYYIRDNGRFMELVCRDKTGSVRIVYEFKTGDEVSGLSAYGQNMFALINGKLHMIYPGQGLCLKLAGAKMTEYVIEGDCAYYISGETEEYSLEYALGTVSREAGGIYRVNLSTGDTVPVIKTGSYGLGISEGKLYFHSLAEPYAAANGDFAELRGKICAYSMDEGAVAVVNNDYDWGYWLTDGGLVIRDAEGLSKGSEVFAAPAETMEIYLVNGKIALYDPENVSIEIIE